MSGLQTLVQTIRASKGLAHKKDIAVGMSALAGAQPCDSACLVGDDCAVVKSADESYLLCEIEGFMH